MKKIILSSALICSTLFTFAQHEGHNHSTSTTPAAKPATTPEMLVVKSAEHDFGKIAQGKPVTYVFEVTNAGKEAIKIENVQASCGCTTPEWDKENAIKPGANSKITVGFNAAAEGPFVKPITIYYNGGLTKVLTIKGEVFKTPAASAPTNANIKDL
jgi:hypothetical protein